MEKQRFWTRKRVGGTIALVWGGAGILRRVIGAAPAATNEAYAAGQNLAFVVLVVMALVGLYYLIKG